MVETRGKTTGQIQAEIMAIEIAERLEKLAVQLRAGSAYVIRTGLENSAKQPGYKTLVTEIRGPDGYVEVVELCGA